MAARMKPRTGAVAMKHARALLDHMGYSVRQEAGKNIIRLPGGKMMAKREDPFGCFDILAFKPAPIGTEPVSPLFVQVTSQTSRGQSANARRRKIEDQFTDQLGESAGWVDIEVWSWVNGKGFYRWMFNTSVGWSARDDIGSPLLKNLGKFPLTDP